MTSASEIGHYVSTATGLCLNFSDFSPSWVFLQTILFIISTGLSVFDTYTDWIVVLNFKEFGFNNPLLPSSIEIHWLHAWLLFTSIGTILTVISVLHDALVLFYSMFKSCKKHCSCKPCKKHCCRLHSNDSYELNQTITVTLTESLLTDDNNEEKAGEDGKDEVDDPCKPCYRCGCNVVTRNETLGAIALWFQNVPMLTIAVLFAFSQSSCKTPEIKDVGPILQDIGISAIAAVLVTIWRTTRSFVRLYSSVGVRIKSERKCLKKCLPKKGDVVYPPDTRSQCCIFGFYCGLCMQIQAVTAAISITFTIWLNFALLKSNFDDSIGIYRYSLGDNVPDVRLFNISGTILQPNDTFVNFEQISTEELVDSGFLDHDLFCLSEFEYRTKDSQIFFNTIQLVTVTLDGRFCANISSLNPITNNCGLFYTLQNAILYYASISPINGQIERFDTQCKVIEYFALFTTAYSGPQADLNINVTRNIDRTGFPKNNEPTIIFYPSPINLYIPVSRILSTATKTYTVQHTFDNFTCVVTFVYDTLSQRVNFNYIDVYPLESGDCICLSLEICGKFHQNLVYAYLSQDGHGVPYTHCSEISPEKLVPYHDPHIPVLCPCI